MNKFHYITHLTLRSIRVCLLLASWSCYAINLPGVDVENRMAADRERSAKKLVSLSEKIMDGLPTFREKAAVSESKHDDDVYPVITVLPEFVVREKKPPKLTERDLLTTKAFASVILKRYHYSAFSMFQYKEDMRLEEMAKLQNFADILRISGDLRGSRDIEKMSDSAFDRSRDSESVAIDKLLNSRYR